MWRYAWFGGSFNFFTETVDIVSLYGSEKRMASIFQSYVLGI